MNLLSPTTWPGLRRFARSERQKSNDVSSSAIVRAGQALGVWQNALGGFVPREVNPHLYEALREAIPVLDGAVNRLVTLDGVIRVEGGNDRIVQLLQNEFMANIPVNDCEAGFQAFYASNSNELYEQGLACGELVMDAKGRELIGLRVADSKGMAFARDPDTLKLRWYYRPPASATTGRRDGTDHVEALARRTIASDITGFFAQHNYFELDPARMTYAALQPEADNPYGVSLFRSMEFVAQILLKIQTATGNIWDRFGDPMFELTYKTKNRAVAGDDTKMTRRRDTLAANLGAVLKAKRAGNAADFVNAIAADDEIILKVIGAEGKELQLDMPARHMLEQIVSKVGIPSWMLGFHWSTAERLAEQQSEMALQESKTRFERRLPGLHRVVATWLRGRGIAWKPGDWMLVQELPNLHDELKRAQAEFMRAQTEFMQRTGVKPGSPLPGSGDSGGEDDAELAKASAGGVVLATMKHLCKRIVTEGATLPRHQCSNDGSQLVVGYQAHPALTAFTKLVEAMDWRPTAPALAKAATSGEPWAEDDAELPRIEERAVSGLLEQWAGFEERVRAVMGLPAPGQGAKAAAVFSFDATAWLAELAAEEALWLEHASAEDGPLLREMFAAWVRGATNAAADLDVDAVLDSLRDEARATMNARGLELLRNGTVRAWRDDILAELSAGAYDGLTPQEVADRLRERFGAHDYDWERLARSEIARSQVLGKLDEYAELGAAHYDFVTAGVGVCPTCIGHASAGPYELGAGPIPVDDSHPNCRCTVLARAPEE